jgi:hypothetical protein
MMMMKHLLLCIPFLLGGVAMAEIELFKATEVQPLDADQTVYLSESFAKFTRVPNTWSWISDVEHVIEKTQKNLILLANGDPAYYMCGDTIPAGRDFELFPYHYYDEWEVEQLGSTINYKLIAQNRTTGTLELEITGIGTATDWNNEVTWRDAFAGKGAFKKTLAPGEVITLWEEHDLKGGLPWEGIVFGKASGDLFVADYAWTGEKDPGIWNAQQMPDIGWEPYWLASFTRGSADWNAATIELFPRVQQATRGKLPLTAFGDHANSIAFAYSPGGPPSNLAYYKAVQPTFTLDYLNVKDPVSGYKHLFLGGNYTIMYRFKLPLVNDTQSAKKFEFFLASNDIWGVDTLAGVWINDEMLNGRVAKLADNKHWRVFTITLKPGEEFTQEFTVVPLGSRWGGMIGSFKVSDAE